MIFFPQMETSRSRVAVVGDSYVGYLESFMAAGVCLSRRGQDRGLPKVRPNMGLTRTDFTFVGKSGGGIDQKTVRYFTSRIRREGPFDMVILLVGGNDVAKHNGRNRSLARKMLGVGELLRVIFYVWVTDWQINDWTRWCFV